MQSMTQDIRLYDQLTPDDCFVACMKSFLPERIHAAIPHHATPDGASWSEDFIRFLRDEADLLLGYGDEPQDGEVRIISGPSPRYTNHAVIGRVFPSTRTVILVHDPHPSRAGLLRVDVVYRLIPV